MSVIRYVSEEEIETNTNKLEEESDFNETMSSQPPPKLRVAVCGPAKAGKTFLLNAIEESYLERYENPLRQYLHMNTTLFHTGPSTFEFTDANFAVQTRDYLAECGTETGKETYLRTCLDSLNDHDLILVEDVRHHWEYEILKQYNFLILYMSTPTDVRHKRSTDITERNFMWSQHEKRLDNLEWNYHDAYLKTKKEAMQFDLVVNTTQLTNKKELWELLINKV